MNDFLIYVLKTISIQFMLLLVYYFLLKGETFFKLNRFYLIGSVLLSFIIPLINFSIINDTTQIIQLNEIVLNNTVGNKTGVNSQNGLFQNAIVSGIYLVGVLISLLFLVYKLIVIYKTIKKSEKHVVQGVEIYKLPSSNEAFSFLNFIFIGDKNTDFELILKHELIHKNQNHSVDLLIIELFKIPFWFNPLLYIFQNKLTETHEFEADETSVHYNKEKYFETIINQVFQVQNIAFTNNFFNQSLIKKRIVMLQKSKSKKVGLLKYATVIPVLILSFLLFSNTTIAQEKSGKKPNVEEKEVSFENLDQIPMFKTCNDASKEEDLKCFNESLMAHIKTHFTYPEEAAKKNIQGKVSIQFIINKDGSITNIITKGPKNGKLLEAEAKRIISLVPNLVPGKQNGKTVSVKYGLPLNFKIIDDVKTSGDNLVPPPPPPTTNYQVPPPPPPTIESTPVSPKSENNE